MSVLVSIAAVLVILHFGRPLLVTAWVLVAVAAERVWGGARAVRRPLHEAVTVIWMVGSLLAMLALGAGLCVGVYAGVTKVGSMYLETREIEATLVDDH